MSFTQNTAELYFFNLRVEIDPSGQLVRAVVWFIDYGNTEVITDIDNIRQMDLQLIKEFEKLIAVPGQVSNAPNQLRDCRQSANV